MSPLGYNNSLFIVDEFLNINMVKLIKTLSPECEGLPLMYSGIPLESAEEIFPVLLSHAIGGEKNWLGCYI